MNDLEINWLEYNKISLEWLYSINYSFERFVIEWHLGILTLDNFFELYLDNWLYYLQQIKEKEFLEEVNKNDRRKRKV